MPLYETTSNAVAPFIFAREDFRIVPVETIVAGAQAIACDRGDVAETVCQGETDRLIEVENPEAFLAAITAFECDDTITARACRARADIFNVGRFRREIAEVIEGHGALLGTKAPLVDDYRGRSVDRSIEPLVDKSWTSYFISLLRRGDVEAGLE